MRTGAADDAIQLSEERGVRYLHFGSRWIQGAMRIARPYALELEYTRQMLLPLALRPRAWPRRVLQIGLGAGSLARFLWRHRPAAWIVVVELREDVVRAAYRYFQLPNDARVAIEIGDGVAHVACDGPLYDCVLVDGYDARGRVGALDTLAFYRDCRRRLASGGVLATNLLTRHRGVDASLARLGEAFAGCAWALPPAASGNVVALAAHDATLDLSVAHLAPRLAALRAATALDLAATLTRLARTGASKAPASA